MTHILIRLLKKIMKSSKEIIRIEKLKQILNNRYLLFKIWKKNKNVERVKDTFLILQILINVMMNIFYIENFNYYYLYI